METLFLSFLLEKKAHLTFDLGSKTKVMAPHERCGCLPVALQMESLSLIFFEIFEKKAHLTFDLGSRSNVRASNGSSYMISYMSII